MRLPLRAQLLPFLTGTVSPLVALKHHGCEEQCAALAQEMRARLLPGTGGGAPPNAAMPLPQPPRPPRAKQTCHATAELEAGSALAAQAAELRRCLMGVCWRVLDAMLEEAGSDEDQGEYGGAGCGGASSVSDGTAKAAAAVAAAVGVGGAVVGGGARAALAQAGFGLAAQLKLREYPDVATTTVDAGASLLSLPQQTDRRDEDEGGAGREQGGTATAAKADVRLGRHVDNTLLTLLWADAPGLEVLAPRGPGGYWTGARVMEAGLPGIGGASFVAEDEEVDVDGEMALVAGDEGGAPWGAGPLLLTVGAEWLRVCAGASSDGCADDGLAGRRSGGPLVRVESAVLHRVAIPPGLGRDRFSLPFLVRLQPLASGSGDGEVAMATVAAKKTQHGAA